MSVSANVTFRETAEAFMCAREPEWRNRKHVQQWGNTLRTCAYSVIGEVRVRDIDTAMIVRILQPIWTKKAETARRVRGRIKADLDAETVLGHRTGSNPARYVDHLQLVLPRSKKRAQIKHHAALSWEDLPAFVHELEQRPRRGARILHLLILTATRTLSVSRLQGRATVIKHGDADSAETHVVARNYRSRFSFIVPRLGRGMHGLSGFARGRIVGARHHFTDGGSIPASRSTRATASDDGGRGFVLCWPARACRVNEVGRAVDVCRVCQRRLVIANSVWLDEHVDSVLAMWTGL
jgi:hypothetical protein